MSIFPWITQSVVLKLPLSPPKANWVMGLLLYLPSILRVCPVLPLLVLLTKCGTSPSRTWGVRPPNKPFQIQYFIWSEYSSIYCTDHLFKYSHWYYLAWKSLKFLQLQSRNQNFSKSFKALCNLVSIHFPVFLLMIIHCNCIQGSGHRL